MTESDAITDEALAKLRRRIGDDDYAPDVIGVRALIARLDGAEAERDAALAKVARADAVLSVVPRMCEDARATGVAEGRRDAIEWAAGVARGGGRGCSG